MQLRAFTLLELLVSLFLGSLILSSLVALYVHTQRFETKLYVDSVKTLEQRYTYERLKTMIKSLEALDDKVWFLSDNIDSEPFLIFSYNNGIHPDPFSSGVILAYLYVQPHLNQPQKKQLQLDCYRKEGNSFFKIRSESLIQSVDDISFLFSDNVNQPHWNSAVSDDSKLPKWFQIVTLNENQQHSYHFFLKNEAEL